MSYKGPRALCMIKIPTFDVSSLCWRTFSSNFLSTLKILSQYFSLLQRSINFKGFKSIFFATAVSDRGYIKEKSDILKYL